MNEQNEHVNSYIQNNILDHYDDLICLLKELQFDIRDDYRASYQEIDDIEPTLDITIATNNFGASFVWQTGDNSFHGACYFEPNWAIDVIYRDVNIQELPRILDILP